MSQSSYADLRQLHAFFKRYPHWLPETASRIGLFLNDDKNDLQPLVEKDVFSYHYEINSNEIQSLNHYIQSHSFTHGADTILKKMLTNRGVSVTDDMIRAELATIMWLGSNVGSNFMDTLIEKINN